MISRASCYREDDRRERSKSRRDQPQWQAGPVKEQGTSGFGEGRGMYGGTCHNDKPGQS